MDFKQLNTFRSAARLLNFSKASHELGYVQSAVTTQIKSLESELAVSLFDRTGHGVSLTGAGARLLEYADKLFSIRDEAAQAVKDAAYQPGNLQIGGYETVLTYRLPIILHQFREAHPNLSIQIRPIRVKNLISQVLNEDIDLVFTLGGASYSRGLNSKPIHREEVIIIANPSHRLAGKRSISCMDLMGETLLLTEHGCAYRNKFEQALIQAGVFSGNCIEFVSIEAIKSCVRLNTGIAAISKVSVAPELANGDLRALDWTGEDLSVGVDAVWNKNTRKAALIESFVDLIQPG